MSLTRVLVLFCMCSALVSAFNPQTETLDLSLVRDLKINPSNLQQIPFFNETAYPADALLFTRLSAVAYCPSFESIRQWSCSVCGSIPNMKPIDVFESAATDTFVFLARDQNDIVWVTFRGTSSFQNVVTDLNMAHTDIAPWSGYNGKIHRGFSDAWDSVKDWVHTQLGKQSNVKGVNFVGHSLGAALATVAAFDTKAVSFPSLDVGLYTIGSPRVGDREFVESFQSVIGTTRRISHYADIITRLPGRLLGFHHVYEEEWYNKDMDGFEHSPCDNVNLNEPDYEDPACGTSLNVLQFSLTDHLYYFGIRVGQACAAGAAY